MFVSLALTAFLTGITEPIEFSFMFLAPVLYGIHAVLTGLSLALTTALGVKSGFSFSAGLIDYLLNFNIATKPVLLLLIGLGFGVLYYFIFLFAIKKFDLKTPGREDDDDDVSVVKSNKKSSGNSSLDEKAKGILEAIGGSENIESIDACVTRIRLTLKDDLMVNDAELKRLGASGIMKLGANNVQVVVGTLADPIVSKMKKLM